MHSWLEGNNSHTGSAPEISTGCDFGNKGKELEIDSTADCSMSDKTSLLHRKLQQLKKQFRPFVVYAAGPEDQLLPSDNPSMNNISVITYDSKGPVINLNCAAKNRTDGKLITCRHLSYAFATGGFGVKINSSQGVAKEPGGKFNAIASIDSLQNNAAIKTDQQLEKISPFWAIPRVAIYFDAEHFGQALYDLWINKGVSEQPSQGKPSKTWLLETENHAMAIRLVPTAELAIKIVWYDPNFTTIVRQVIVMNEEVLQQLTLDQFLPMLNQTAYAIDQGRAGVLMSPDTVEVEHDSNVTIFAALTPSLLHLLMEHGQLNNSSMGSLKTTLSQVRSDNPHKLIMLLAAKSKYGTPGLYKALQNGYHEAISAYIEAIKWLQDIIEPEVIEELLAAKKITGPPGFYIALQCGHCKAISAYVEGIKQLRDIIKPEVLKALLAAKSEDGVSGLFIALQNGDHEAVRAYLGGIKQFRDIFGPRVIWELLAAKMGDVIPGLFMALQKGHQKAIRVYLEGIKQFIDIIGPEAIKELLAAKTEDGVPGLFVALQNGHHEAISAYIEVIKQLRDMLGPEFIKELLAAKTRDETPGLFKALGYGHWEAVSAYIEGIKQFQDILEPEVLWELLIAKDKYGNPGFFVAQILDKEKAIRAYVKGVKQFGGVAPKVIKELLVSVGGNLESTSRPLRN